MGIILYALSFAVTPASTEQVREVSSSEPELESKTGEEPEQAEEKKE